MPLPLDVIAPLALLSTSPALVALSFLFTLLFFVFCVSLGFLPLLYGFITLLVFLLSPLNFWGKVSLNIKLLQAFFFFFSKVINVQNI